VMELPENAHIGVAAMRAWFEGKDSRDPVCQGVQVPVAAAQATPAVEPEDSDHLVPDAILTALQLSEEASLVKLSCSAVAPPPQDHRSRHKVTVCSSGCIII
jgi:hypothetical protein